MNTSQKQCTPHTVAAAHGVASSDAGADRPVTPHLDTVATPRDVSKPRGVVLVWRVGALPPDPHPQLTVLQHALLQRSQLLASP